MNKALIYLIISTSILVLSAIVICISPIINNIEVSVQTSYGNDIWNPVKWRNLNCAIFGDKEKDDNVKLDDIQRYKKIKNICYRQKAMYGLENSAFVINIILAFICTDLSLLHFFNIRKDFKKNVGLIGIISGAIGFILTLVYVCFSGYIFTNDVAYGIVDTSSQNFYEPVNLIKLYDNGAKYKYDGNNYITVYKNDNRENANYLLYKDLAGKQYNYNSDYYKTYMKNKPTANSRQDCNIGENYVVDFTSDNPYTDKNCIYLYNPPQTSVANKYIYDRWLTALILSIIIVVCHLALAIFGFLLFNRSSEERTIKFQN